MLSIHSCHIQIKQNAAFLTSDEENQRLAGTFKRPALPAGQKSSRLARPRSDSLVLLCVFCGAFRSDAFVNDGLGLVLAVDGLNATDST